MPTLTCIFYLMCLGVVYLFRTFYRGWAIPYLLLVMAAAPVLILLLSLPAMLRTELRMEGKPYVVKGERGEARFVFRSKRLLPVGRISLSILVENHYTGEHFHTQELFYSVSGGEVRVILFPTDSCGKISFRITRWECRDLLGFFSIRRRCQEMFTATVLPVSTGPEKHLDIEAACQKEVRLKPKYGGGFSEDYDLRDYRPGDMGNNQNILLFIARWTRRIGAAGTFIGTVMFGFAVKDNNAVGKVAALKTFAAGAIVVSVSGILSTFA